MDDIAKATGYNVVGHVTQHREAIDTAYCIGEGKLDEVARTIDVPNLLQKIAERLNAPLST